MNYYEILGCEHSATYEELKKSYQQLAKLTHPDKTSNNTEKIDFELKFMQIDQAWKVLRDAGERKIYDSTLQQKTLNLQQTGVIYAELSLGSLTFDEDNNAFYPCRCGESIAINKDEFAHSVAGDEVLFECTECSNNISVTT